MRARQNLPRLESFGGRLRWLFQGLFLSAVMGFAGSAAADSPGNIYLLHCAGCHGINGAGNEKGGIPDFRNYVGGFAQLPAGRRYVLHVPGVLNSRLGDVQLAAVMNHLMTRFGGSSLAAAYQPFSAAEVSATRRMAIADIVVFRRALAAQMRAAGLAVAAYPWP